MKAKRYSFHLVLVAFIAALSHPAFSQTERSLTVSEKTEVRKKLNKACEKAKRVQSEDVKYGNYEQISCAEIVESSTRRNKFNESEK